MLERAGSTIVHPVGMLGTCCDRAGNTVGVLGACWSVLEACWSVLEPCPPKMVRGSAISENAGPAESQLEHRLTGRQNGRVGQSTAEGKSQSSKAGEPATCAAHLAKPLQTP